MVIASSDTVSAAANSVGGGTGGGVGGLATEPGAGSSTTATQATTSSSGASAGATAVGSGGTPAAAGASGADSGEPTKTDGSGGALGTAATASGGGAGQPLGTTGEITPPPPVIGALLLSEYVESSKDKALELSNTADEVAFLDGCQLEIYFNGNAVAGNEIALTAELPAHSSFVVCKTNGSAELLARCDQSSGSLTFNGDDTIVLSCDGEIYDSLGELGTDPGAEWTGVIPLEGTDSEVSEEEYGTADHVLRRRCGAEPRLNPTALFDLTSQWSKVSAQTSSGSAVFDYSGLGSPDCAEAPAAAE